MQTADVLRLKICLAHLKEITLWGVNNFKIIHRPAKEQSEYTFSDKTQKALRKAHNIPKMYKAGAFNE